MVMKPQLDPVNYADLLGQAKQRIRQGQTRTVLAANSEMIRLYWDIGRMLHERSSGKVGARRLFPGYSQ